MWLLRISVPQTKHRLKVDYESCAKINPRIVYGSLSGFGQDGPYDNRPGVDQILQGMGGLMSVTGIPGQGPVRVGIPICDLTSGMFLGFGMAAALFERERSGKGQWVQTSLLQAIIAMMDFQAARVLKDGDVPKQMGNDHPTSVPTGVFKTKDGHINIAASVAFFTNASARPSVALIWWKILASLVSRNVPITAMHYAKKSKVRHKKKRVNIGLI